MAAKVIKFRHGNHKGLFHYIKMDGVFVALSEVDTGKVQYIKEHRSLDITFELKEEKYDVYFVDVIEDKKVVQEVYDAMLKENNTYFKDGIEGLCVLKFHL